MTDKKLSGLPPPSPSPHNGGITDSPPKYSPALHHNGSLEAGSGPPSPSRTSASAPLRTLRTLGGLLSPGLGAEGSPSRPRGQSLGSALNLRTRPTISRSKRLSSQQEEPEALLDLILECQGQRLEDQRASLSLLPDPGPAALCGACGADQPCVPGLDFYYMLIHYQSDRMEDQRCSLPDLDDVVGPVPEGQEDFFSLIQRVQSRRMDEQRAALLLTDRLSHEDDEDAHTSGSSPHHHHHHH